MVWISPTFRHLISSLLIALLAVVHLDLAASVGLAVDGLNDAFFYFVADINIGKLSKGTAHEMVDFICEKTGLSSEDILQVAYKQNYSFVYIRSDKTEGVIEAVNGQTYKGRKVKMNFSKDKDEQ